MRKVYEWITGEQGVLQAGIGRFFVIRGLFVIVAGLHGLVAVGGLQG